MNPFDSYPEGGRKLLGPVRGSNCRRVYCREFMQQTGQKLCAYCGCDFTACYPTWLTMVLDHVVPASVCASMHIDLKWRRDYSNAVLACAACNGFCNRYSIPAGTVPPATLEAFYDLRDRIFAERKKKIAEKREEERLFFSDKPWESKQG
jgi:5-methylcytosine-specific restriction endonuclease McrA